MIRYLNGVYGASILFRFHGSALVKAVPPAIVSTALLYSFGTFWPNADITKNVINRPIEHPYAIGCFVVAFTFLVTFRVNFSYSRVSRLSLYLSLSLLQIKITNANFMTYIFCDAIWRWLVGNA